MSPDVIRTMRVAVAAVLALVGASACAVPVSATRSDLLANPSRHAMPSDAVAITSGLLLDVRLDRQGASNGCGAHAAASLLDYWLRAAPMQGKETAPSGAALLAARPPEARAGYSLRELVDLLTAEGMVALAVTTTRDAVIQELADGRPVIVRVTLPTDQVRARTLFPFEAPVFGRLERAALGPAMTTSRLFGFGTVDHYWVAAGHTATHMLVLDPAMGLRQVRFDAFDRAFDSGGRLAVVSGGWALN